MAAAPLSATFTALPAALRPACAEACLQEVPPCRSPVGTADGLYLRRAIGGDGRPACHPMHFHEMQAHQADRGLLDFVRLIAEEGQGGRLLSLDDLLVLNALWQERAVTTDEAARLTQKPEDEARAVLNRLVEAGLVEARGERKGRAWLLSAATYRRLGQPDAYVRQRGFEPLQQAQMVLQYVEKHGRITRREAAELCRISGPQAYRLLDRLAREGHLTRHGERGRGVSYIKGTE